MNLWVDDLRNPDSFGRKGWHWARTVTEAIRVLDTMPVEEVSLDHDISHSIGIKNSELYRPFPCGETFEPVARFIRVMCDPAMPRGMSLHTVRIHTANPVGVERMKEILTLPSSHSPAPSYSVNVEIGKPCNGLEEG